MNRETVFLIIILYIALNIAALLLFWIDKRRAMKEQYRIKESTLLTAGFLGPFGAIAGMEIFRHKTRKLKFKVVYLFPMVHLIIIYIIFFYFSI
ncbi:hypothetical protein Mpt1_c04610 [Candidatus Methanoplasma termitum]|uniref:DUF1294 domain-containing protein n=1 Tax=Candidatus Methanoplasma termitum TaxID=1577791 RepID=A0A0A7LBF5_9ARCH|nr:DUF1294 domain-containing protein [Candidatus Methanoplasma termitum]AIZ56353.1 hypothetical protein Mpt1_c04610 [Candidatus Methanoplasma termitum]MCL2333386.1 DUF1294 domain-containing protein [Candidatus Methanoplasma sp.]